MVLEVITKEDVSNHLYNDPKPIISAIKQIIVKKANKTDC